MRKIKCPGGHAPGGERRNGECAASSSTQTELRKMDDYSSLEGSTGNIVCEESTMIDYYELLMEQQESV